MISTQTAGVLDSALERVRYYPRQIMTADEMRSEQEYFRQKMRRHNRLLHGWGVSCGCEVKPAPDTNKPWQVRICPGYLLTPQGEEVLVSSDVLFDLATCIVDSKDPCAFSRPCPPIQFTLQQENVRLFLAVRYIECQSRPVRVAPVGCGCDDANCEFSRIRDAYEFCCLPSLPATHTKEQINCDQFCAGTILPCPPRPDDPWVVLATIALPSDSATVIANANVDNLSNRRVLYSTTQIQGAVCACSGQTIPAPTITPPSGTFGFPTPPLVTIAESLAGAQIRYTLDGSDPTPASAIYTVPFKIDPGNSGGITVTVKARAYSGDKSSPVTSVAYYIEGS
jgi:Chitobiase/beta-hexosaminidase C-terminal domain